MSPALVTVRLSKGKIPPTLFKVIVPALATNVIDLAMPELSKVPRKSMSPPAVVIVAVPFVNVTALENSNAVPTVVMFTP